MDSFPHIKLNCFSEKDCICHSLIDATISEHFSSPFFISVLECLSEYQNKYGEDFIIDELFLKYTKMMKLKNGNNCLCIFKQLSQYHIIFLIIFFKEKNIPYKKELLSEMWKLFTNDTIYIQNIPISNYLILNTIKELKDEYIDDWKINEDINDNKMKVKELYDQLYHPTNIYNFVNNMNSIDHYSSSDFWQFLISNNLIKNQTIIVNQNPYLFNAAAFCYHFNPSINI